MPAFDENHNDTARDDFLCRFFASFYSLSSPNFFFQAQSPMDNLINHNTQEELIRLREQLIILRGHFKSTAQVTAEQEAIVNQIRTQLQTFDPNTPDFPQTRNWYKQHDSLAMEKDKLDDIAKQQNEITTQATTMEERVNQLETQAGQHETAIQASQSDNDDLELDLYAALDDAENTNTDDEPTTEDILLFQLSQSQQQINALTQERDALKTKNLLSFKRCAILSREKQLIEKQNLRLRTQRNVLQSRLDILEDQGIDIGEPRNDAEAEARISRKKQRERRVYDGLAGAKIFPAQEEAYDGVVLETELLDATDQIVGAGPPLLSPKEKHAIDMLFEEDFDDTNATEIEQEINAPVPQQFVFGGYIGNDMVYENNEDLIDWTQDDEEYKFTSYHPVSLQTASPPSSPLQTGEREIPEGWQDNGGNSIDLDQEEPYKIQRDAALAELEKPWEDLSRPLSPRSLPHYFPPGSPKCEEKLAQLQSEINAANEELCQTRGELESLRRDFATKSAEGKGARLRIKVLEEEILERELKEQQLREELRLEREEDPLADNLFVELNEVRRELEACEEERADIQGKLREVQDEYAGYKVEIEAKNQELKHHLADAENAEKEATARVTALEEAAEKGNAWVGELEQKIVVGNGQLESLTDTIWAREEEIKLLTAELETLKEKLQLAKDKSEILQNLTEALAAKEQDIQRLQAELQTKIQELERARSYLQGCNSNSQKLRTGLDNAEAEVKKLTAQLIDAIGERDQARNEARNAVVAAEKARDEVVESRRELEASNDLGNRLRSISAENISELASVREERDTAVHNVVRLERDLNSCREDVTAVKAKLKEISNERDDLVRENQNVVGRYMDAERRAEEHWRRVVEGMTEIERLRLAANKPGSPLAHIPTPKSTPKPTKPTPKSKSTGKPKHKSAASTSLVRSSRPPRLSRNPNPIYTAPLSPGSPTPPPTTPTAPKPDRKRKRGASEADEANKQQEKKRRRK
jgi:chromosome segregation ATPase